jgi:hypothetical protein
MEKDLLTIVAIGLSGPAALLAFKGVQVAYSHYRENHPAKPTGAVFIDPRSEFEKFMEAGGYKRYFSRTNITHDDQSPWPNPNPDSFFGRFATRNGYFRRQG